MTNRRSIAERDANTVTVSPKFQVVIPREIREQLQVERGQKLQVVAYGDRIELIPIRPMRRMRGFLPEVASGGGVQDKGLDTTVEREDDRA